MLAILAVISRITIVITHIRGLITLLITVISRITIVITYARGLITLLITAHEPPSSNLDIQLISSKPKPCLGLGLGV